MTHPDHRTKNAEGIDPPRPPSYGALPPRIGDPQHAEREARANEDAARWAPKPLRVYVAGASQEIERCENFVAAIREVGCLVEHDWCAMVRGAGNANHGLDADTRLAAKSLNRRGVAQSDVFVLLLPQPGDIGEATQTVYTIEAWWELGMAEALRKRIVLVGEEPERTVMSAGLEHIASDAMAVLALIKIQQGRSL